MITTTRIITTMFGELSSC